MLTVEHQETWDLIESSIKEYPKWDELFSWIIENAKEEDNISWNLANEEGELLSEERLNFKNWVGQVLYWSRILD